MAVGIVSLLVIAVVVIVVVVAVAAVVVAVVAGGRSSSRVVNHKSAPCRKCGELVELTSNACTACGAPVAE